MTRAGVRAVVTAALVAGLVAGLLGGCTSGGGDDPARSITSSSDSRPDASTDPRVVAEERTQDERDDLYYAAQLAAQRIFSLRHDAYDADVQLAVDLLTKRFAAHIRSIRAQQKESWLAREVRLVTGSMGGAAVGVDGRRGEVLVFLNGTAQATGEETAQVSDVVLMHLVRRGDSWLVDAMTRTGAATIEETDDVRREVLSAANRFVTTLHGLDHRDGGATERELAKLVDADTLALLQPGLDGAVEREVRSSGRLEVAGVGDHDHEHGTATVWLVASGTTSSTETGGNDESFRVRMWVELLLTGGRWTVTGLGSSPIVSAPTPTAFV